MKITSALHLYRVRLRARLAQECCAVVGIAAGVALLFASQISSSSLQSSVAEISRGIVGNATLQLIARDPHGFPQSLLRQVRQTPGVQAAAPLLEAGANAIGPKGSESVEIVGADESLKALGGALVRHAELESFGHIGAVVLPAPLAKAIGVSKFGQEITFQLAGRTAEAPLYQQLHASQIGSLIDTPIVVAPLFYLQEMTGLSARVSRILVQPAAGARRRVQGALETLAGGRMNVEPADYDEKLFAKASTANNQSTALFSVISALVGFLFAFNAMLLTVPQRRALIADLRRDGYTPRTVIGVLLLDAVAMGLIACVIGLALGDELSIHVFHSNPAYLSLAFALGSARVVSLQSIVMAVSGGMLAAIVAVLSPLRDILSRDPLAAISLRKSSSAVRAAGPQALVGLVCLAGATAILLIAPSASIPAMVLLVAALLLVLPFALSSTLRLVGRSARNITSAVPHLAAMELSAARARAVAIAATGAIAVFGSVAVQGAHDDLLKGLQGAAHDLNSVADVWVSPAGSYNLLKTTPFTPREQTMLRGLPDVRTVGLYRSGLLDYGQRRVWVVAPPGQARPLLSADQLVQGDLHQVTERLQHGGWLVLSRAIAREHHLHVGESFTLPSPNPERFRLAGLSTNLSWAPGAIIMNSSDYAHAWASQDASAYDVLLQPNVSPEQGVSEIRRALGAHSGLTVETSSRHVAELDSLNRQALARLSQIATLILLVAVLAMASAMGAMVWQRRPRLAKLKLEGIPRAELWRTILLESLLLLGVGCLTGAIFGVYGQQLADRTLVNVVNFPVVYSLTALDALESLAVVTTAALAILTIPGYLATRVPAALALQD